MDRLKTAAEMRAMVSDAAEQFSVLDLAKARLMAALEKSLDDCPPNPPDPQRLDDVRKTLSDLFRMAEPMTIGSENISFHYGFCDYQVKISTDKLDIIISILPCMWSKGPLRFPGISIQRQA